MARTENKNEEIKDKVKTEKVGKSQSTQKNETKSTKKEANKTNKSTKKATEKAEVKKTSSKKAVTKKTTDSTEKKEEIKVEKEKKLKPIESEVILNNDKKDSKEIKEDKIGSFESIVIMILVALFACVVVYLVDQKTNDEPKKEYATASKEIQTFIEQYNNILENYYGDIDENELIENAIKGMLTSLDDYSEFIDDSSNSFNITLEGSYEGIGIEIVNDIDGNIVVYRVYADTPAAKAGIQAGDFIVKINDEDLKNVTTSDFVTKVADTADIKLVLLRNSEQITVEVKREKIELKSVAGEMLENNIGYVQISIFANNTYKQFKETVEKLEKDGMKRLIIDVRSNSGGHLDTVKAMLSYMMDKTHVIYQIQDKTSTTKIYSTGNKTKTYPIVVLQNRASASASEMLSSSLQEQLGAYVIGNASYGKGTVQQLHNVSGIGQYKFTTKKWLTSNGTWIHEVGVKPDLEISLSEDYYTNPVRENDNQLNEAIKYFQTK